MSVAHYENFPVASRLVPRALRPAVVAIYAFARGADDIADEGDASPGERIAQLDAFASMLDRIERGETPTSPPFTALALAIRRHALPLGPFRDLLSAFRQDVTRTRYASFCELADYCSRSANPIGRLLLRLYGVSGAENGRRADAVCTGLQLTNFWQDIAVDWHKGRVYLPGEDLARFGVAEEEIAAGRCDERWERLLAFECERARALLESGHALTGALPLRLALELKLIINGGLRILRAIDAVHGDVFRHRPRLRGRDWLAMATRTLVG
ncbi:MAG: squalene synthase HpnC [Betaproteobacteria bacterium]|nr:MAG: squalene synthase HpnC [Betaproteobacteria bacterium]